MSDLSTRILNALDEAVAQEVGARLRQAAQNVPTGSARPTLPAQFEESLKRLKALYTQVKAIVDRTFGDPVIAATSTSTAQTLRALRSSPALETLEVQALQGTSRVAATKPRSKRRKVKR
jgi:hypothetical protein